LGFYFHFEIVFLNAALCASIKRGLAYDETVWRFWVSGKLGSLYLLCGGFCLFMEGLIRFGALLGGWDLEDIGREFSLRPREESVKEWSL
jgi:hypothetical protein